MRASVLCCAVLCRVVLCFIPPDRSPLLRLDLHRYYDYDYDYDYDTTTSAPAHSVPSILIPSNK